MAPQYRLVRPKRSTDHERYAAFVSRIVRRWGVRLADDAAEPEDLAAMMETRAALDDAITRAMIRLHRRGHSWAEIGRGVSADPALQLTKQAVAMRVTRSGITDENLDDDVPTPAERRGAGGRGVPGPRGAGGLRPPAPRG